MIKKSTHRNTLKELENKVNTLDMKWVNIADADTLRNERAELEEIHASLDKEQTELISLLPEEEVNQLKEDTTYISKRALELRSKIGERIFEFEKGELRSSCGSRLSHSSKSSSNSSILKMKAMTELARTEVEMKYAKLEAEKQMEMQQKKHEIEEIQRFSNYEKAKAAVDVLTKTEEEIKCPQLGDVQEYEPNLNDKDHCILEYILSLPSISSEHVPPLGPIRSSDKSYGEELTPKDQNSTPLNIFSKPFQMPTVTYTQTPSPAKHDGIAQAISQGMQAARLPMPYLKVFTGDPLEWPTWKASFETVIEKRTTNASERILYRMQYLSGALRKIVEGYQFLRTDAAYNEAKKKLEERFGHLSVVAEAFRSKLENWKKIPAKDGEALREFSDFLKTCQLAMQTVEDLETLNKQHENKQVLKTLPSWAYPKWGLR